MAGKCFKKNWVWKELRDLKFVSCISLLELFRDPKWQEALLSINPFTQQRTLLKGPLLSFDCRVSSSNLTCFRFQLGSYYGTFEFDTWQVGTWQVSISKLTFESRHSAIDPFGLLYLLPLQPRGVSLSSSSSPAKWYSSYFHAVAGFLKIIFFASQPWFAFLWLLNVFLKKGSEKFR